MRVEATSNTRGRRLILTIISLLALTSVPLLSTEPDAKLNGKYHKIKFELVAPDGGPLTVPESEKAKFLVYTRKGYQMPKAD
jgi:hypothetical protein